MRKAIVCGVAVLMMTSVSFAQGQVQRRAAGDFLFDTWNVHRLNRGDVTVSGAINFVTPAGSDIDTSFNFQAAVGYFVTDYIEIEAAGLWLDSGGASGASLSVGANRYFREMGDNNMFPYIGGGLTQWFEDFEDTLGTRIQLKAGVRHYLSRHMGIRYWAQLDAEVEELGDATLTGYIGLFAHPY